ncbi:hypothetical protein BV504_09170 [Halomonas sp. 'Soap Lake |nr:hypothetical protein B2G49_09175 [Halomonas sp. 'Soap Lake \
MQSYSIHKFGLGHAALQDIHPLLSLRGLATIAGALWLVPRQALHRATNMQHFDFNDFVVRGKRSAPAIAARHTID